MSGRWLPVALALLLAGLCLMLACAGDERSTTNYYGQEDRGDWCAGYSGDNECCRDGNPCGLANDARCSCGGVCFWDVTDCGLTSVVCQGYTGRDVCCQLDDPCGLADTQHCDCYGYCVWDERDCHYFGDDS